MKAAGNYLLEHYFVIGMVGVPAIGTAMDAWWPISVALTIAFWAGMAAIDETVNN